MEFKGLEFFLKKKDMFLERVIIQEGCWGWNGHITDKGYARFKCEGKQIFGHIISWQIYIGEIPFKHFICHKCDNPICCNPNHLFVGLPADNSKDMKNKNRSPKGSKHLHAVLKEEDVKIIKKRLQNKETSYRISKDYSVNMSTIYSIQYGNTWSHVTLEGDKSCLRW